VKTSAAFDMSRPAIRRDQRYAATRHVERAHDSRTRAKPDTFVRNTIGADGTSRLPHRAKQRDAGERE